MLMTWLVLDQGRDAERPKGDREYREKFTNINHKGLQRTANEYAGERRIYKDLISKNEM